MPRADHSIARKLTTLTVLASLSALVTAAMAFGLYDRSTWRANLIERRLTQARILAANSASALAFDDPRSAEVTLRALEGAPNIIGAIIARPDGSEFAAYRRDPSSALSALPWPDPPRLEADRISVMRPITLEDQHLGNVVIVGDLGELASRRGAYIRIAVAILSLSLLFALVISWRMQRTISGSIVALAQVARDVSIDRDYSRRAAVVSTGIRELTMLGNSFNAMLEEIQSRDRSLRKAHDELEERVRRRTAELDASNKELEAFSYSVSHDLRAPLRHVSGFAEMLEEHAGPKLDDQGRKYIKTITASARRMAMLIDDLLDFSRVGRAPLKLATIGLSDVVREAQGDVMSQLVESANPNRHILWRIDALPEVYGDPAMLRQVFVNFLSNAVKYTSKREEAVIEVGISEHTATEVTVFVRDNGVGFDMRYADKLFGVFQRLHRADEFEGTGIGLANIKRTIVRHGGKVSAMAEVDRGATFYVTLPTKETPS
jgi:signal transduction histidine kinase